jgi:uncharacterized protein
LTCADSCRREDVDSGGSPVSNKPPTLPVRVWNFLAAPFCPGQWQKCLREIRELTPRKAAIAAVKVCIYYLLFSPLVAMPFYNTCIFHPFMTGDYAVSELAGVKKRDVYFSAAGGPRLHGWYFQKAGARKTVLISHGNAGNLSHRKDLCTLLLTGGASVFIYDYGGYGLCHGTASVDGCCRDAISAYDYLNKILKVPSEAIVLYGESIGTAFTCQIARQRPCRAIILQSGFQSLPQIAYEKIPPARVYPECFFPVNHLDTLSYVKGKHPPLLFIHGTDDNVIPCHNSEDMYAAASPEKALVKLPGAGHNDVPYKATYQCLLALSRFLN